MERWKLISFVAAVEFEQHKYDTEKELFLQANTSWLGEITLELN